MKLITAPSAGFCFGVEKAVETAMKNASPATVTYGEIIHNAFVTDKLAALGVRAVDSLEGLDGARKVIIRSHGAGKAVFDEITRRGLEVVDATCPFVRHIHKIVRDKSSEGYHIVIVGEATHPEVVGTSGWCEGEATVIDENSDLSDLSRHDKLCFVVQTTYSAKKFGDIIKKIHKHHFKTVEIFDTICYTTGKRQSETENLAKLCDVMLVVGDKNSSNTTKLYDIGRALCERTFHIEGVSELKNIIFNPDDTVGLVAGASTPTELIMEVKGYMSQNFEEVQNEDFIKAVDESLVNYKEGRRFKGTVIFADDKGIHVNIGGKKDGLIHPEDVNVDGSYRAEDYKVGDEIEAIIINRQDVDSGCVLLSKKEVDLIREGDKVVETIRNGEVFELAVTKDTKGGLLSKLGTYTVFIPASQVRESFVKDLKPFVGKTLRLTALEIDDQKHKIVASARKVLEAERKEREEIFWTHVQPNVVVNGKVKRITNFGAFVSVDGFDCLAHIVDLSWNHIKSVDEVLTIGQNYDFLVLSVDKEKGRVSLGYKQLQPHPFVAAMEKHPVGSTLTGKVVSIVPFGAFVEIEPGIEGLVHVSEAAHSFVKNMTEVVKVGDMVEVMVLGIDEENRKVTLSMKACQAETGMAETSSDKSSAPRSDKKSASRKSGRTEADDQKEWSEDLSNNPFADLLKDLDVK